MELESSLAMAVSGDNPESSLCVSGNQSTPAPKAPAKKKRSLPGMPDPDAEVVALSPKSLLATNRFVCEICSKGFQRDQNLQLHRRGHNLPWKLRQRTSTEVRKRVYVCPETSCVHHDPSRALGDLTGIKKHFCRKHGEKKWSCERCAKKYAVQSDWKAHMKTCGTREYRCDCGTLFSRRDSFTTHRAFCDALAQESVKSQTLEISNPEQVIPKPVVPTSSSSPPPPPLTPSTGVLSPVASIQSSELPENQNQTVQLQQQPPAKTDLPATIASGGASTNVNSSAGVFASIFASSSAAAGLTQSSQSPSSYSDLLCAMAGSDRSTVEPMSLSLSSPFYLTNTASSLFPTAGQDHLPRYTMSPQPALSATALLQKAAQIGATSSNSSFLRGFGLAMPSSSDHHQNTSGAGAAVVPTATTPWNGSHVKLEIPTENSFMSSGFGLGLHSQGYNNEPTTLDLLGLGLGVGGTPSNGFSAFFTSMGGDLSIAAATAAAAPPYGGLNTAMENWVKSPDRKPSML